MTSACSITREALEKAPLCACTGANVPQCIVGGALVTTPPASCQVLNLASHNDLYFKWQYSPGDLASPGGAALRRAKLEDLGGAIELEKAAVRGAYGADAPVDDISFWKMQRCLASETGARGPLGNKYIDRAALEQDAGYAPQPLVGGSALKGRLPAAYTRLLPVMTDRLMNPDLMFVVLLVFILAVLLALGVSVARWQRGGYRRRLMTKLADEQKRATNDPYAFMGPEFSVSKADQARAKIFEYEAQGYCMRHYRETLGMPAGPRC